MVPQERGLARHPRLLASRSEDLAVGMPLPPTFPRPTKSLFSAVAKPLREVSPQQNAIRRTGARRRCAKPMQRSGLVLSLLRFLGRAAIDVHVLLCRHVPLAGNALEHELPFAVGRAVVLDNLRRLHGGLGQDDQGTRRRDRIEDDVRLLKRGLRARMVARLPLGQPSSERRFHGGEPAPKIVVLDLFEDDPRAYSLLARVPLVRRRVKGVRVVRRGWTARRDAKENRMEQGRLGRWTRRAWEPRASHGDRGPQHPQIERRLVERHRRVR